MSLTPLCTPSVSVKMDVRSGEAAAVRCKRWSCEVCRESNRKRVIAIARYGRPRALLTLTVSSTDYPDKDEAASALKRGLRLLRLRLKRHPKLANFEFLAVFEKHVSGWPHLHLLIRGRYLPWQELRRMWEEMTGSYMVDIRKISTEGEAAWYCAKYIGKDLSAFANCKRWWRSHGYSDDTGDEYQLEKAAGQWSRLTFGFYAMQPALEAAGWLVEARRGARIAFSAPTTGPPPKPLLEALREAAPVQFPWGPTWR